MSITLGIQGTTGRVMGLMAHMDTVTALAMAPTRAVSQSRLAIGPIILAARVIMWAGPTTSGDRDIGHGATVKEAGSTATTL